LDARRTQEAMESAASLAERLPLKESGARRIFMGDARKSHCSGIYSVSVLPKKINYSFTRGRNSCACH
jgi:hypothetical protein